MNGIDEEICRFNTYIYNKVWLCVLLTFLLASSFCIPSTVGTFKSVQCDINCRKTHQTVLCSTHFRKTVNVNKFMRKKIILFSSFVIFIFSSRFRSFRSGICNLNKTSKKKKRFENVNEKPIIMHKFKCEIYLILSNIEIQILWE